MAIIEAPRQPGLEDNYCILKMNRFLSFVIRDSYFECQDQ